MHFITALTAECNPQTRNPQKAENNFATIASSKTFLPSRFASPFRILTALACATLGFTGHGQAIAQSLRFAPPIFNVSAISGANSALNLLNGPSGVAVDAAGDLYVADTNNRVIRKVSPTQTATIFAGNGGFGYTGDNDLAISASMKQPTALAVNPAGNVYFSDPSNDSVRKIDTAGIITTFAGGNGSGSSGNGGLATGARLVPAGLATDALGNVYIIDTFSQSVRVVSTADIIDTYAGGGSVAGDASNGGVATLAQLNSPTSLAMDSAGNLYIGDSGNFNVRMVDKLGVIHPFAGTSSVSGSSGDGGPAINATLYYLNGIAIDPSGNVYITGINTVRVIDKTGVISTLAGTGSSGLVLDGIPANRAPISLPGGLAADNYGNLFLSVPSANDVYRVNLHPEIFPQTQVGTSSQPQRLILQNSGASTIHYTFTFAGDFGLWSNTLAQPHPCVQAGFIFSGFSDWCTLDVVFTPTAEGIRSFPLTVNSNDIPNTLIETLSSSGLGSALAMTSGLMYIVAGNHGPSSDPPTSTGPAKSIHLTTPSGVVVDSSGNVFFSESPFCLVERVNGVTGIQTIYGGTNAIPCTSAGNSAAAGDGGVATSAVIPFAGPLALDAQNNLYIASDGRIRKIDFKGQITTFAGPGFIGPGSMVFDSAGNLYFVETGTSLVRKINTAGILSTVAGTFTGYYSAGGGFSGDGGPATSAQLNQPQGLAVNSAGDLFISDTNNYVIRKVTAAIGKISTIAGQQGVQNYSGDGGPAVNATLNFPMGLTTDAAGDVFVADYQNFVIRKIDTAGIITTVAGNHLTEGYNGDGLAATETTLAFPNYIFSSPGGHLFISDTDNELIREMSPNGALIFQPMSVGTTSASQSVAVSNIGNLPLHFDPQSPTGMTGDFAISSGGTCDFTATLAVGAGCNVNVTFTPTVAGARSGILAFYDDGIASPQYVALSGTGTAPQPQSITFVAIPNHIYGDADFNVSATSNSGLPVALVVKSGNATLIGSLVHITGVGPVAIAAGQAGSAGLWLSATEVMQSFTIASANLLVAAQNAASTMDVPLAPLTYAITGFVYGESAAVLAGAPALSTTATPTSPVGYYTIYIAAGTLAATNYNFTFSNGQYTVNPYVIPNSPVKLTVTAGISLGTTYVVAVTVANTGGITAQNVVLTSVKLNAVAGAPAARSLGAIPAGGSISTNISVPISAGVSGAAAIEQIAGTYTGGSFGGSFRVVLP